MPVLNTSDGRQLDEGGTASDSWQVHSSAGKAAWLWMGDIEATCNTAYGEIAQLKHALGCINLRTC